MRLETFFKNEGPMGNNFSHLRIYRQAFTKSFDLCIIAHPGKDNEKESRNIVLNEAQAQQLRKVLNQESLVPPPCNIYTKEG